MLLDFYSPNGIPGRFATILTPLTGRAAANTPITAIGVTLRSIVTKEITKLGH